MNIAKDREGKKELLICDSFLHDSKGKGETESTPRISHLAIRQTVLSLTDIRKKEEISSVVGAVNCIRKWRFVQTPGDKPCPAIDNSGLEQKIVCTVDKYDIP